MRLIYIVVDDAKKGLYHPEPRLDRHPFVKVCLQNKTWNFVSQRNGTHEVCLYNDAKPLGSFSEWSDRLPCGLVVGVLDADSNEHAENYSIFKEKVAAWKERRGIERRHTRAIHPL